MELDVRNGTEDCSQHEDDLGTFKWGVYFCG